MPIDGDWASPYVPPPLNGGFAKGANFRERSSIDKSWGAVS
jgi:hypothetical protein